MQVWFKQPFPALEQEIDWLCHPKYKSFRPDEEKAIQFFISADQKYTRLLYPSGPQFIFENTGKNLWIISPPNFSQAYLVAILLGTGFGFYLGLLKKVCLHASAVAIDGRAVLFCAPSGYGKSTTALYFAGQGYPVLSDDISLLELEGDEIYVTPSYAHIRVWDAAVPEVKSELQPLAPERAKTYVNLQKSAKLRFSDEKMPVGALYLLIGQAQNFHIEQLETKLALATLMRNTFMARIAPAELRAADFALFTKLLENVPVKQLLRPPNVDLLPELYSFILEDLSPHSLINANQ